MQHWEEGAEEQAGEQAADPMQLAWLLLEPRNHQLRLILTPRMGWLLTTQPCDLETFVIGSVKESTKETNTQSYSRKE